MLMKQRTRSAAALLSLLTVVSVAACTTTVAGHGAPASVSKSGSDPKFAATTDASNTTQTSATRTVATRTATTRTATATSPAPATTAATRAQLDQQLGRLSPGERQVLVAVPGAYEAVTYDQAGHLTFWRHAATWTTVGHSTYPHDSTFGPPSATVTGARLSGMKHATFIAEGYFSGDGSGNATAYTTGTKGWGAIKAESNGNIGPSGQGVGFSAIGLADEFRFVGGLLMTADCSAAGGPIAACSGQNRVIKYWRWAGSDFVLDHRSGLSH
jgi:hypothetical protein